MINFRKFINPVQARKRRYKKICQLIDLKPKDKILDLGCGEGLSFEIFNQQNTIIGLDKTKQRIFQKNFTYVQADASNLSFLKNKEFDLVVCIGVLEHVFPFKKLKKITKEIQRLGKSYVIVIPHKYTLIEPHYQSPLWQFFPDKFKSFLIKRFSIGWFPKNSKGKFEKLNYFDKKTWLSLFPDASIISYNHIFGLIWNFIIYKK